MILGVFGWLSGVDELIKDHCNVERHVLRVLKEIGQGLDYHAIVNGVDKTNKWITRGEIEHSLYSLGRQGVLHMRMEGNPFGEGENKTPYVMRYYMGNLD